MNKIIISLLIVYSFSNSLHAQTPGLSGVWELKQKENVAGPNYSNSIPKKMVLALSQDSLILSRTYDGGTNKDYTIEESLALNGSPTELDRTVSKRKSVFKKGTGANSFSIEVTYRDLKTGQQTSADFTETWNIASSGNELTIKKEAKEADGSSWGVTGIYQLKTAEELAAEAATGRGIQFAESNSWGEIKAMAKKEGKYIFVDCFATWCVPCKKMEKEIFSLDKVGAEMNDKFISVRLQMDTTKNDEASVKAWYATAHDFGKKYNLVGYPTFLFFDADGNIVHKGLGMFKADEFIELLKEAKDPNQQYYSLLNSYRAGKKDNEKMYQLALAAKKLNEQKTAEKVLKTYKKSWMDKLPVDSLLSEKYLKLASDFYQVLILADGSKGRYFKLMYNRGKLADGILTAPGFSSWIVNTVVSSEEIYNKIYVKEKPVANPNWDKIQSAIKSKYPGLNAEKLVLDAQIGYYTTKKDRNNQVKFLVKKIETYGPLSVGTSDGQFSDNTIVSVLLPHCEDPVILNKAVGWMETIINSNAYMYPVGMVYGNYGAILYKAGKKKEGIEAMEKHLAVVAYKNPSDNDKDPRIKGKFDYLERMKRGEKIDSSWKPTVFN